MKLNTLKSLLPALLLLASAQAHALNYKGRVYDKEGDASKPLYTFERTERKEGDKRIVEGKFHTPDGKLALVERFFYSGANTLFELYEFERPLSQEKAIVRIADKKLHFSYDEGAEHTDNKESLEENTVNRDEVIGFVGRNWGKLMAGEKLKSRFVLPDRAETIGFGLRMKEEITYKGMPAVKVVMFALSPFVAMAAGDTFLVFEKAEPHRMLEVDGRAPVLKLKDGKWRTLQSRIEFDY